VRSRIGLFGAFQQWQWFSTPFAPTFRTFWPRTPASQTRKFLNFHRLMRLHCPPGRLPTKMGGLLPLRLERNCVSDRTSESSVHLDTPPGKINEPDKLEEINENLAPQNSPPRPRNVRIGPERHRSAMTAVNTQADPARPTTARCTDFRIHGVNQCQGGMRQESVPTQWHREAGTPQRDPATGRQQGALPTAKGGQWKYFVPTTTNIASAA